MTRGPNGGWLAVAVLMVVAALPPAAPADSKPKAPDEKTETRSGIIKAVDHRADRLVLTVDTPAGPRDGQLSVDADTQITVDGQPAKLVDLAAGMLAKVTHAGAAARKIEATTKAN